MPQTILLPPFLPILKVRLRSAGCVLAGVLAGLFSVGAASASGQCLITKRFPPFEPGSGATPALVNPLAPTLKSRLKVVVMGDSVMWGNGLKPEDKFVFLFGQDMARLTGREVEVTSFAHSGATLNRVDDPNSTLRLIDGQPQGDLDSQRPTTKEQADCAPAQVPDAEIVLLDGCINEVGGAQIAFPFNLTNAEQIANDSAVCGKQMRDVLGAVRTKLPAATIILVNYYRVVSADSRPLLGRVAGVPQPRVKKGSPPAKVARLDREQQKLAAMSGAHARVGISANVQPEPAAIFQAWDTNSEAFLSTLQTCFNWAIAGMDHPTGGASYPDCDPLFPPPNHRPASPYLGRASADSRVFLATVPDDPEYSYGAPQTHLWRYPVTFLWWHWGDDLYSVRLKLCHQYFKDPVACYNCSINTLAHPNVKGAQFFRDSLITIFKSAWATGPG